MERQLRFLDVSAGLDMEFDTFASPGARVLESLPQEGGKCHRCESAIKRQKQVVDFLHSRGRELVSSAHTGVALQASATAMLATEMRDLGADGVQIVNTHAELAYCPEHWKAILASGERLGCPFTLLSIAPGSALLRVAACHLGCGYLLGRPSLAKHYYAGHEVITRVQAMLNCLPRPEEVLR